MLANFLAVSQPATLVFAELSVSVGGEAAAPDYTFVTPNL